MSLESLGKSIKVITALSIGLRIGGPQKEVPETFFRIERTPADLNLFVISIDVCAHLLLWVSFLELKKSIVVLLVRASIVALNTGSCMMMVSGEARG